jgi:hypothetical protein
MRDRQKCESLNVQKQKTSHVGFLTTRTAVAAAEEDHFDLHHDDAVPFL